MYLNAIFSTSIALLIAIVSAAPVEEGFIDSTPAIASTTPAGFNLTYVEAHQPSGQDGDANYTVAFHIEDSAGQTDCSISWPMTAPADAEKYVRLNFALPLWASLKSNLPYFKNECNNVTFTASITTFANISSFSLDLDHYYANER